MVPEQYKIPFSAIFTIFLSWFLANIFGLFTCLKSSKAHEVEANNTTPETSDLHARVTDIGHTLKDGLYLLSIAVILNTYMGGNKTSVETFSLIAMFSVILSSASELIGIGIAKKGLWVLFLISIFAIFVTAFATPGFDISTLS